MNVKLAIARRQLGTALALFLEDKDPVSVHCLACGGGEIAYRIAHALGDSPALHGVVPWLDHVVTHNPEAQLKDLLSHRNRFWNAMKHATSRDGQMRSDDNLLAQFDDQQNDELLFISHIDFALAYGTLTVEAHAFQWWFMARYPSIFGPSELQDLADEKFPGIENLPRHKAKRQLRRAIERDRKDRAKMSHPRTDRRQLILGRETHPLKQDSAEETPNQSTTFH
jgi:hypothetical protein